MTPSTERHSAEALALLEKALGNREIVDLAVRCISDRDTIKRLSSANPRTTAHEQSMIAFHRDITAAETRIRAIIESL